MYYKRLTQGLNDKGTLYSETDDLYRYITDDQDWYESTYKYNTEQYNEYLKTGTVSGITEVVTDKLWWDFDCAQDPSLAKDSAIKLIDRLVNKGINPKNIVISFSGKKGFGIELLITDTLTPTQARSICFSLGSDLPYFDTSVYNAARILRLIGTKHQKSGLYKIPLTYQQIKDLSLDDIRNLAKAYPHDFDASGWVPVSLPNTVLVLKTETKKTPVRRDKDISLSDITFENKPKFLTNCRWALQNGAFKDGERNSAFLCLASTYKNLGFDLEHVYRLLKGVAELQSKRNNMDRYDDNELYNNIVLQVFGPSWKGGQFSCRDQDSWLHEYCSRLGNDKCNHKAEDDLKPQTLIDLQGPFKEYVKNIEKNTIKTGLPTLDKYVFLSTGANVGFIAAPGAGKTSFALELLSNTSKAGVRSVFASLDMARTRMFEKVMYRLTGLERLDLYQIFKSDKEQEYMNLLREEFGNVSFFKKSSPTTQDIRDYVLKVQEETGEKVKLVMIDYFERINSDMSDDTASSKRIAGELQDLVDELDICLITLVQPHKHALSGGPDQPIYDYTKIKGSSFMYQSFRIILSCWRPFYNPQDFSKDDYMQMAVLKNDLGELAEMAFGWNGKRGTIRELEDAEQDELKRMLKEKANQNQKDENGFG